MRVNIDEIYVVAKNQQLVAIKLIIFDSNWHLCVCAYVCVCTIGFTSHARHIYSRNLCGSLIDLPVVLFFFLLDVSHFEL